MTDTQVASDAAQVNADGLDQTIWDYARTGMRPESIDIKVNCSPKRVKEALARMPVLEPKSWQFEQTFAVKKPERTKTPREQRLERTREELDAEAPAVERGRKRPPRATLTKPERKAAQSQATSATQKHYRRNRDSILNEPVKIAPLVLPPKTTPATDIEIDAAKTTLVMVYMAAFKAFNTNAEELRSRDKNVRTDGYRHAILLVLDHLGVRPEVGAVRMDREHNEAGLLFEHARKCVLNPKLITEYSTRNLCFNLKIEFRELLKKLRSRV